MTDTLQRTTAKLALVPMLGKTPSDPHARNKPLVSSTRLDGSPLVFVRGDVQREWDYLGEEYRHLEHSHPGQGSHTHLVTDSTVSHHH